MTAESGRPCGGHWWVTESGELNEGDALGWLVTSAERLA